MWLGFSVPSVGKQRPCIAGLMAAVWMTVQYLVRVRPWMYTWGADPDEVSAALPGDELVGAAVPRTTRAVTIDAPAEMVWKWLVQIGEGRGGFYSYSWLERAVGARIHNAQTVHPEWQHAQIGDPIWLARRYGDIACLNVVALKPNSHLVLLSEEDFARVRRGGKARGAWAFYLERTNGRTRLVARSSGGEVGHFVFDVVHFVMEQKMLRSIRHRAEQTFREHIQANSHLTRLSEKRCQQASLRRNTRYRNLKHTEAQ